MSITVKEFDSMVEDVLRRITNSTNISNINPGSVIRTIVEALLAEQDIQYYQIDQIFNGMNIDKATGEDLDNLVKILGVVRKEATKCTAWLTFGRSSTYPMDIPIPLGSTVSTQADADGNIIEFVVTQERAFLPAGNREVDVLCTAKTAGNIYIPQDTINVMNSPILNIEYVYNSGDIFGGSDVESDDDLRKRAKDSLSFIGRGTTSSLEMAVRSIDGIQDVICMDMNRGVGTADIVIVTASMPPSQAIVDQVSEVIRNTKSAGIDVSVTYPTIKHVDVNVNVVGFDDLNIIGNSIVNYAMSLSIGNSFLVNQMERHILNACNKANVDIVTVEPISNVTASSIEIIRSDRITINGVVWDIGEI